MPTYDAEKEFWREFRKLKPEQQEMFLVAKNLMLLDLKAGKQFSKTLRISALAGHPGIYEMTWEYHDGRATFEFRTPPHGRLGPHIHWRRIGGHEIFARP